MKPDVYKFKQMSGEWYRAIDVDPLLAEKNPESEVITRGKPSPLLKLYKPQKLKWEASDE